MPTTRGMSPPARSPAAAHAGAAGGRARAAPVGLGFVGRTRAHFLEGGFAWAAIFTSFRAWRVPLTPTLSPQAGRGRRTRDRDRLGGGIVEHRELGGAQALDLVTQPRGLLEVEIGRGGPHPRLKVGDHRLEIVTDGSGIFLADAAGPAAGRDQHMVPPG